MDNLRIKALKTFAGPDYQCTASKEITLREDIAYQLIEAGAAELIAEPLPEVVAEVAKPKPEKLKAKPKAKAKAKKKAKSK